MLVVICRGLKPNWREQAARSVSKRSLILAGLTGRSFHPDFVAMVAARDTTSGGTAYATNRPGGSGAQRQTGPQVGTDQCAPWRKRLQPIAGRRFADFFRCREQPLQGAPHR